MRKLTWPDTPADWEKLAAAIVKANLKLAGMSYIDLEIKLAKLGVTDNHKNISNKVGRGKFTAAFFLQALVSAGVENLELPKPPSNPA